MLKDLEQLIDETECTLEQQWYKRDEIIETALNFAEALVQEIERNEDKLSAKEKILWITCLAKVEAWQEELKNI